MSEQKSMERYLGNSNNKRADDLFVNLTIHRIPATLLNDFGKRIASKYQGGIGEAIQDLMEKAVDTDSPVKMEIRSDC